MAHRAKRERDNADYGTCHYCEAKLGRRGDTARTIDHIVPVSLGGREDEDFNRVLACRKCNLEKADSYPPQCKCKKCSRAVKIHFKAFGIRPPGAK